MLHNVGAAKENDLSPYVTILVDETTNKNLVSDQGGLRTEVGLGDDIRSSPFKLSILPCGLIKLQIEFVLGRWVTCYNKMLYH